MRIWRRGCVRRLRHSSGLLRRCIIVWTPPTRICRLAVLVARWRLLLMLRIGLWMRIWLTLTLTLTWKMVWRLWRTIRRRGLTMSRHCWLLRRRCRRLWRTIRRRDLTISRHCWLLRRRCRRLWRTIRRRSLTISRHCRLLRRRLVCRSLVWSRRIRYMSSLGRHLGIGSWWLMSMPN
uniref:Putative ovule protein n=1 Tax=Solanum chacoense TaxID=4108 RepID=A0A0V0HL94_SOLCH